MKTLIAIAVLASLGVSGLRSCHEAGRVAATNILDDMRRIEAEGAKMQKRELDALCATFRKHGIPAQGC